MTLAHIHSRSAVPAGLGGWIQLACLHVKTPEEGYVMDRHLHRQTHAQTQTQTQPYDAGQMKQCVYQVTTAAG